ncbi:sensor histidine kinase [Hymenobacter negativus]|uniref:Histidine kinase n=1 Tax=Hymenobacter negativus TaxID=2795026 RepID=A0ABS3QEN3_9BACT|nr:sensor histidine kinase [Hymenobacter negativus]MBO2009704.1 histidine kinase [Hymenobacter negativus]
MPSPFLQPRVLRILIHVAVWLALAALVVGFVQLGLGVEVAFNWRVLRVLFPLGLLAGFFYLNYWVLIPRLLAQRRFAGYFALVVFIGVAFAMPMILRHFGVITKPTHPARLAAYHPLQMVSVALVLTWVVSSALRITGEWLQSEEMRKQLHSDQLAAELAFLKSQVNPHFLFNTLNNVYSLAELKSDDAPAAILKLSHLMRYMLYEAHAPRVPLTHEIEHLRTYVDLQRLRLDPDQVPISFDLEGDPHGHLIEPMLLIPFVENAFKHGISFQHPSDIGLHLRVGEDGLLFTVRNHVFAAAPEAPAGTTPVGGVGLQNVKQRLRLLYPSRHNLALYRTETDFTATLTLTFDHAPLPVS